MRVPGRAWLEMSAEPDGAGSRTGSVRCSSRGLAGRIYWWAVAPFHGVMFAGMANRITAEAEAAASDRERG